jgi:hypothetical protein
MDKLIHDQVYAEHNAILKRNLELGGDFPLVIAGILLPADTEEIAEMKKMFQLVNTNGNVTGMGFFRLGQFSDLEELDEEVFGYVICDFKLDSKWRPPPTLMEDVEAGLRELMGDLYRLVDGCQIGIHCHEEAYILLGDYLLPDPDEAQITWGENDMVQVRQRYEEVAKLQATITGLPHREKIHPEDIKSPYSIVQNLDRLKTYPPGVVWGANAYRAIMPDRWDPSLSVCSVSDYQIYCGENMCAVGHRIRSINLPSPEEFDLVDEKLKSSLGLGFSAHIVALHHYE